MKMYSTKEFAELAGVSIRTLKRWRKSGKLTPIKTGDNGYCFYADFQLWKIKNVTSLQTGEDKTGDIIGENPPVGVTTLEEHNLQIYPLRKVAILIDKLKTNIFNPTKQSTKRAVIENKKTGIKTPLLIKFSDDFKEKKNITAYDELVFDICVSEQLKGNEHTTPAVIHRAMGGSKTNFTAKEKDKILHSIQKLSTTWIEFDCSQCFEKFGYNDGKSYQYNGNLLPSEFIKAIKATVNGQTDSAVIHFLRKTPLLDVAMFKGQIITCDTKLLDVPNIKNTDLILGMKGYLLRRVLQIVGSHKPHKKHFAGKKKGGESKFKTVTKLQPIILFETLFEQCGLADATKRQQQQARETIKKILDHFKAENLISDWLFEKKNGKFFSIHLII